MECFMKYELLLLALAFLPSPAPAEKFVQISAEIELTTFRSDLTNAEANAKPRLVSFLCIASPDRWRIDDDWMQNALNRCLYDGTNIYESPLLTAPPSQEIGKSGGFAIAPFEMAKTNLTIRIWNGLDGHPRRELDANIAWLAFCSGKYLQRDGRLIPLPCDGFNHSPDRYAYSDKTEVFPDSLGLPRSIDLYLSKSQYLSSIEGFYKGWGERYLGRMRNNVTNLQEGSLMFHYAVTATTNFNSCTFPLRFEFLQKPRNFIQNGSWFTRGIGTLKSIREAAEPKPLFDPAMKQTVVDWRFHDDDSGADANMYNWTSTDVPNTNDPALQAQFQVRIDQARSHRQPK
jgi:hypothetical protein